MTSQNWLSLANINGQTSLWAKERPFATIVGPSKKPSLVALVGRKRKATLIRHLAGITAYERNHSRVCLIYDPRSGTHESPTVYIDYELQVAPLPLTSGDTRLGLRPIPWFNGKDMDDLTSAFAYHCLNPLSSVICYFAGDLSGITGVSDLLARQAICPLPHTLPRQARAHILVIVETTAEFFDPFITQKKLHTEIMRNMVKYKDYSNDSGPEEDLRESFHSIQIVGLQKSWTDSVAAQVLRRRLMHLVREAYWGRRTSRHLFSTAHIDALSDQMLDRFCKDKSLFSFIKASRPQRLVYKDVDMHLRELFGLLSHRSQIWALVVPLLASSLFLSSYPPESHRKSVGVLSGCYLANLESLPGIEYF